MDTIRLGVIGYGGRGRGLFGAAGLIDGVEAVAVCDPSVDTGREEAPGLTYYAEYLAMLDSGTVDAVLIETPPRLHALCAIAALRRNIHVFSDVPAINAVAEARPLYIAARDSKAFYMFGANPNYWDFVDAAVELKARGLLGEPFYLEAEYVHDIRELAQRTPWRQGYEPIRYCTHSLGPLLRWLDEDLEWVSCFDTGSHVTADPAAHDAMVALFRTPTNVVVKVLCTFVNNHPCCFHRYVYHGTKGYFERSSPGAVGAASAFYCTTDPAGPRELTELPPDPAHRTRNLPPELAGHGGADGVMLLDFVNAVRNGGPPPVDVRAALRMTLPGLYACESARQGGAPVRIEYPW